MKKLLIALSAISLVLTACQKEASFEDPNAVPGSSGTGSGTTTTPLGLLIRKVEVLSSDSSMTDYGYDGSKRFITHNYSSSVGDFVTYRMIRNANGIITKYSYKDDGLPTYGIDSLVYTMNYDNTNARYTSSVGSVTINSIPITDSFAYAYDGSGNLSSKANYVKTALMPYALVARTDFTYSGGNVASEKYYADTSGSNTGNVVLTETYFYTYDGKVNPLQMGAEALLILDDVSLFGSSNLATLDYVDGSNVANNYKVTSTYQYNTSNKPTGGTNVQTPGSVTSALRYYYN